MLDDVIEIKVPDPDSQYRLVQCPKCDGENVAYEHYVAGVGSDGSAAGGGESDLSEWQRSANEEGALPPTKRPGTATGAKWRVRCFDCGHIVDKGNKVRHDAQLAWNGGA